MAGQTPTLSSALHADLGLLAQSGGAHLRLDHPGTHPTRRLTSVPQLEAAIHEYLDHHNANRKPFVWTKLAEEIFAKVTRACNALEQRASGKRALNALH
jgi:hypothetical protein